MIKNHLPTALTLKGVAYLDDISISNSQYCAHFKLLPAYNAQGCCRDEITLVCDVNPSHLKELLIALMPYQLTGCTVMAELVAHYRALNTVHHHIVNDAAKTISPANGLEPQQLIFIAAELQQVLAVYVDGVTFQTSALTTVSNG